MNQSEDDDETVDEDETEDEDTWDPREYKLTDFFKGTKTTPRRYLFGCKLHYRTGLGTKFELYCFCKAPMVVGSRDRGDNPICCDLCKKNIGDEAIILYCTNSMFLHYIF